MADNKIVLTASNIKYLLVIRKLNINESGVRSTDIAKSLGITKPSVHTMIKAFQKMKIVRKDHYGIVWFTDFGKQLANRYESYFKAISSQLKSFLPENADTRSIACAMFAELKEDDIKAMCKKLNSN